MDMRFIEVRGVRYLHAEDVVEFIAELGATEETDVRNRLNEAARNIRTTTRPMVGKKGA